MAAPAYASVTHSRYLMCLLHLKHVLSCDSTCLGTKRLTATKYAETLKQLRAYVSNMAFLPVVIQRIGHRGTDQTDDNSCIDVTEVMTVGHQP